MSLFPRVIPVLTYRDRLLVKPLRFGKETYIGDPLNAVRIFNEKQVDEIVLIDISASEQTEKIDLEFLEAIASEAFMPVAYGGGVNRASVAREITAIGAEKVILNTAFTHAGDLVTQISSEIGSQSTVVSIDVRRKRFGKGHEAFSSRGKIKVSLPPLELALEAQRQGAGEILLHSIDRENTFEGYDIPIIERLASELSVPLVALGGARNLEDFRSAIDAGASGVAAGSAFVMQGKHRAVLITYPTPAEVQSLKLQTAE